MSRSGIASRTANSLVEETEARIVRHIFARFMEIGSGTLLAKELAANGILNRSGRPIDKKAIYRMLSNRHYLGEIVHKEESFLWKARRHHQSEYLGSRTYHLGEKP